MTIEDHFLSLLRPIFPSAMEVRRIDKKTDELIFRVHAMHSRKIEVRISRDVLDDYRDDPRTRPTWDAYIDAYLRERFREYVDDGILDPPLDWGVTPETYTPKQVLRAR